MKKTRVVLIVLVIFLVAGFSIIGIKYKKHIDEVNRYEEIKEDINKEMERYIYLVSPNCEVGSGSYLITHKTLVYNAGMDKEKLLDIDKKSYCKVYIDEECIENKKHKWNTYISCNNYTDEGYKDWDE